MINDKIEHKLYKLDHKGLPQIKVPEFYKKNLTTVTQQ